MTPSSISRTLASPRLPLAAALLFVLLVAPTVTSGLVLDDYSLRASALGVGDPALRTASTLDLFRFTRVDPTGRLAELDAGWLPWWTVPALRIAFFRPLASASHWLDFHLFAEAPLLMHAENVAIAVGVILAWSALYARLLSPRGETARWVAGLAALFYAIHPGLAISAGWIAGRNTLLSALFGSLALLAHDRWRRDGWRRGALLGPLALAASLAAGEAGVGAVGLLAAHAATLDGGKWKERARALAPYAAIGVLWGVLYRALGYGAAHSGIYVDPAREPVAYVRALLVAVPVNVGGELGALPPSMYALFAARALPALALAGAAAMAAAALAAVPILQRDPTARFFALGALLAVLPVSATLPNDRNLAFVSGCLYGLSAQIVALAGATPSILRRAYAAYLLLLHLVAGPPSTVASGRSMMRMGELSETALAALRDDEALRGRTVVVVNPAAQHMMLPLLLGNLGTQRPSPARLLTLAPGTAPIEITRTGERTLRLRFEGGMLPPPGTWPSIRGPAPLVKMEYLAQYLSSVVRGAEDRMHVGDAVALRDCRFEVLDVTSDGRATDVVATFERPLDDPSFRWFVFANGRYGPFVPPALGQVARVPALAI